MIIPNRWKKDVPNSWFQTCSKCSMPPHGRLNSSISFQSYCQWPIGLFIWASFFRPKILQHIYIISFWLMMTSTFTDDDYNIIFNKMPSILSFHVALLQFPCRWSRLRPPLGSCSCCGRLMESLGIDPPWWHGDNVHRWRRLAVKKMEIQSGKKHMIFYQFDQFLWETGHECCKLRPFFQRFFHCRATLFLCKVVQPADSATEVCRSCGLHSQALGTTQRLNSALQMSGFHKSQILLFFCGKSHPRLQAWMKYDEIWEHS